MKIGAAIFVKTPGLSPIKTRLGKEIGKEEAEAFHLESAKKVCEELLLFKKKTTGFAPHWAVAEEAGIYSPHWSSMPCLYQGNGELGHRLHRVYNQLIENYGAAFLLGSDSPEINSAILESAVTALKNRDFVIGPATDGGFYLFGGKRKLEATLWDAVPYSTSQTAALLLREVKQLGTVQLIQTLSDIDTVEDLQNWKNRLSAPSRVK